MPNDINQCQFSGRLTRDPEMKYTATGTEVLEFSIACNESRKGANDEWIDDPCYIDCSVWGQRANYWSQKLSRGLQVFVSGHLKMSSWTDKNSQKVTHYTLRIDQITVGMPPKSAQNQPKITPNDSVYDEEIPF